MKNLTHYFQVAKSPSDELASSSNAGAEENTDSKEKNADEDSVTLSNKSSFKPKKLSLKSKKSQKESKSDGSSTPTVASPDSTVDTSEKKRRSKCSEPVRTSEKVTKTPNVANSLPIKTSLMKTSMQNILQSVLKKKILDADDGGSDSITRAKNEVDSLMSNLDEIDEDVEVCAEITSSVTPKSGKKRGRKPKNATKESDVSPGKGKPSYEELEHELLKERLLLAKLKESFLASNPDKESLAKYNSTLSPKSKAKNSSSLSDSDKCDHPSTPKAGRRKLSNGIEISRSAEDRSKSPKKSFLSTPKSLPPKALLSRTSALKKSSPAKKTPENDTKIMKEVLEFLDHSESKNSTPSPKKSSPVSKSSEQRDKSLSKSKKHLEFAEITGETETPNKLKKKKKIESEMVKSKNETSGKASEKKKECGKSGATLGAKKRPKSSPKKLVIEDKKDVLDGSPSEAKRKRKKRTDSIDGSEGSLSPASPGNKKTKVSPNKKDKPELEPASPPKKRKMSVKNNKDVCDRFTSEKAAPSKPKRLGKSNKVADAQEPESTTVVEKKKRGRKRKSEEPKKIQKESLVKEPETSANSQNEVAEDETEETVDLNSSSDSIFVDSSQKTSDGKKSVKSKSEVDSEERKNSQTESSQDSSQKNSLLKYFGKVDKTYMKKEEKSVCLTTRAIVHSPPVSPSKKRKSTEPPFSPRRKKLKTMLVDADKIELLSSELIPNTEFDNSNDTTSEMEIPKKTNDGMQSKEKSPKKWSMRVKLAVQSPSKLKVSGNMSPDSSPETKVKRKLFGSQPKPPAKDSDEGSSDSHDVQVIEEKAASSRVNGKEIEKVTSIAKDESAKAPSSTNAETPKPPVKLASIFLKKSTPKTNTSNSTPSDSPIVIDDETLQAKKDFLSSGVPDIIKQKSEQLKALEKAEEEEYYVPFPKISHVGYNNSPIKEDPLLELEKSFNLRPKVNLSEMVNECLKKNWKYLIDPVHSAPVRNDSHSWPKCNDGKRQQRYLKKQAGNFPFEVFETKFEKISSVKKSSDVKHEMWTEKYKPQSSQEVLGNGSCVAELKQWLEEQKASKKKDSEDSSGDEFVSSDEDSSLSKCANNVAILSGPPGCGKTSSVYAVAKELGCKVLELNASCNRNGKKVLSELLEATQSHQVKQASNILADMFSKASKQDKKKKKKEPKRKSKSEGQDPESKVMSIILIEGADLIFSDHDDGFIAALSSLSTLSKRPIILISNSIQCSHLSKFIKQQCLLLEFNKPSFSDMRTFLQLIALSEMVELSKESAEKIVYETKDLRQAILTLQYHLLSAYKPQTASEVGWPLDVGKLWWQWPSSLSIMPLSIGTAKKSTPLLLDSSVEKSMENENGEPVSDLPSEPSIPSQEECLKFHKLASFVDNLALAEIWSSSRYHTVKSEDPSPKAWSMNTSDSCLLNERTNHEHAGHDSLSVALSHEFICRNARYLDLEFTNCVQNGLSSDLVRWKKKLRKVEQILLTGLPMHEQIDRGSIFCDYLPMIRSISRSECLRLAGNSKRSNRFFNYLSNLNMHPDESQRTLMCNAFNITNETASSS